MNKKNGALLSHICNKMPVPVRIDAWKIDAEFVWQITVNGNLIAFDAVACPWCGERLPPYIEPPEPSR